MNKIKIALLSLAIMGGVAGATIVLTPSTASAQLGNQLKETSPKDSIKSGIDAAGGANEKPLQDRLKTIVNILLFVLGAIAVIMIVIGGIRYTTSNGESSGITGAKNTILYAVVGLVIALLAYAIVNFVVGAF